jgi:hypothetical protein
MDMHEHARTRRLRERPPVWPRREDGRGDRPGRRPWEREREPFEEGALPELYPGSLAMEDMVPTEDDSATLRVLARYTVLRLLLLSISGALSGTKLRTERHIALDHLALLPEYDWERRSLERLARLCSETPAPELVQAATGAAEAAAKRSQAMGAFALYRTAYELAIAEEWWAEAAQVARGIAQLARLEEAGYSIRLWRKRAVVLDGRAARAAAAADSVEAGVEAGDMGAGVETGDVGAGVEARDVGGGGEARDVGAGGEDGSADDSATGQNDEPS